MSRLIGVCILLASFLSGWLWMDFLETLDRPLGNATAIYFEIHKGQGLSDIANALHEAGVVEKSEWFQLHAVLEKAASRIKFGEYEIPAGTTLRQLLALFVSGKVRQHSVTLVEGWRFEQMRERLRQHAALDLQWVDKSGQEIMALLGEPEKPAEGQFFPDTFFFTKGMSDAELLKKAHRKMQSVLQTEWERRDQGLPLANAYEALVLASVVEKETARPDERAKIAGVFIRRLQKGMLLQTDPTVIYGMGDAYQGNIGKDDLLRDTPYNTYLHPGLPPTPIAAPGLQAIQAALHPEPGEALYFVSRGDGTHVFSTNLDEHQKAVDAYQKQVIHE